MSTEPTMLVTYAQALLEGTRQAMELDPNVIVIGEGVPDPGAIFGTTKGLLEQFGPRRVFDMPLSENGITGVCIGASFHGIRPILIHQRIDFALLSLDQIINNAAKWSYTFNGQKSVPLVIRMIIGRGWGQGPQHSQSLQALFAHIPGLKVVMPSSPSDAKALMISAVEDNNPVIFIEHRWLQNIVEKVPKDPYRTPIDKARLVREGEHLSLVAFSYMVTEAIRIADALKEFGIDIEVIDMRSLRPLDIASVSRSVRKTGKLICLDSATKVGSISSEIIRQVVENDWKYLDKAPISLGTPDHPVPTTHYLANRYYLEADQIARVIIDYLDAREVNADELVEGLRRTMPLDKPFTEFSGPF